MTTIYIEKRYTGNGTTEPVRPMTFIVRALKSSFGAGYTWHIIFENGKEFDTLYTAKGHDAYLKRELKVLYK